MSIDPVLESGVRAIFDRHGLATTTKGVMIAGEVIGAGVSITVSQITRFNVLRLESPATLAATHYVRELAVTPELEAFLDAYQNGLRPWVEAIERESARGELTWRFEAGGPVALFSVRPRDPQGSAQLMISLRHDASGWSCASARTPDELAANLPIWLA